MCNLTPEIESVGISTPDTQLANLLEPNFVKYSRFYEGRFPVVTE